MTVVKYFILTNSDASLSKRFRVLHSGYDPVIEKSQTVKKTLTGGWDIASGGLRRRHDYLIRASEEDPEEDDGYGSLADLETFFSYNEPNGTPSNRVTLTDHFGRYWIAVMDGSFPPKIMGAAVEGPNSYYVVKATFLLIEQVEGPS